ncbi:MAG: hypothetical protein EPO08_04570 [Rhodospirillaceae bacterium]|nr:MAG: hypothetical protein EPO08_04570 [Rhodospirillaceae bacterium]
MSSLIQSALSDFETKNKRLVGRLTNLLDTICASDALHGLFLNTLSMMEHIGSRKIMVTQGRTDMDQPTLKHLADETRHAFFMKRHAETATKRTLAYGSGDVLAHAAARMYFQRLELAMRQSLSGPSAAVYLYMSMIVEFRATWGYGIFQAALKRAGRNLPLKSLLAEEEQHLEDMARRLDRVGALSRDYIDAFTSQETRGFERLLSALEQDSRVAAADSAPREALLSYGTA